MSIHDDKTRLGHMLFAAQKILHFTENVDRVEFDNDEKLQLAIIRLIEIIGEAAARLTSELYDQYPHIAWQAIIGMRNRLVHAYFAINLDIVWNTIEIAIPQLVADIDQILESLNNPPE